MHKKKKITRIKSNQINIYGKKKTFQFSFHLRIRVCFAREFSFFFAFHLNIIYFINFKKKFFLGRIRKNTPIIVLF